MKEITQYLSEDTSVKANERKPRRELSFKEQKENRRRSALRARKTLVDAVNANFGWARRGFRYGDKSVKFLTLTYKENMTDYKRLSGDFDLFKHRLEYHLKEKIQYVCVPEQQKRGAWHLHVLLFCSFLPIDTLKRLWNQGGFNVKRVQCVHNVGKYIGKYVGKDFEETDGIAGRKRFWCSQGFTKGVSRFRLTENPNLDVKGVLSKRKLQGETKPPWRIRRDSRGGCANYNAMRARLPRWNRRKTKFHFRGGTL